MITVIKRVSCALPNMQFLSNGKRALLAFLIIPKVLRMTQRIGSLIFNHN